MPKTKNPAEYYDVARNLLQYMDENMRQSVDALLRRADLGEKTDTLIIDIITQDKTLRHKFREMLNDDIERTLGGYSPLGGVPSIVQAKRYVCPIKGHKYTKRITKAGENPGNCPEHNVPLIPAKKKKGSV